MASLPSILILGADTIAAARPATPVQLVQACRLWGFSAVVPASWGDELIASDVIRRCSTLPDRSVIQCSCPRVADRLAPHAEALDDAVFWLVSPPAAVGRYLRSLEGDRDLHITYAGGCPGASDPSIDEYIGPTELLSALHSRGIEIHSQSKVFEDVVPADRRRHSSCAGGLPEQHRLWEATGFRLAQPSGVDLSISIAQLLLADERSLIDLSPTVGCLCRMSSDPVSETELQRSPTPVVIGTADLSRPAPTPAPVTAPPAHLVPSVATAGQADRSSGTEYVAPLPRSSVPTKPAYRRQSTWRRQSPRPGVVVARPSTVMLAASDRVPVMRRAGTRWIIALILAATIVFSAFWVGRRTASARDGSLSVGDASAPIPPATLERPRSPESR